MICLRLSYRNVRSAVNKAMAIKSFNVDNDIDALALTEIWFHDDNYNVVNMGTLCAAGCRFLHNPRAVGRSGGVGELFKGTLRINNICYAHQTFELMDMRFQSSVHLRVFVIFWPPESTYALFYE